MVLGIFGYRQVSWVLYQRTFLKINHVTLLKNFGVGGLVAIGGSAWRHVA
jgi:hypothetical protein